MSKNWTYSWQLCFLKELPQFSRSSAKIMGIPTTWPAANKTRHQRGQENWLLFFKLCTIGGSWFYSEFFLNYTFTEASMHMISRKGLEFCWNGYFDDVVHSYDSHKSQWRSADAWRGHSSESFAMNTDTHTSGSMVKNRILLKNGIRRQCNTENFVPIVVPGFSSSSSSGSHPSTLMTPSRQDRSHPTDSSSSSTSPTTTVSSDSETRAREDLSGIDSHPVSVSKWTCRTEKTGRPVYHANPKSKTKYKRTPRSRTERPAEFWHTGMAARIERKSCGWRNSRTHWLARQFFSWTIFRAYACEKCGFVKTQCLYVFPWRPKLRDLSEDQNHKGTVQKTHWRSRTSCWKFGWLDNSRSQGPQWHCESRNNHRFVVVVPDLATQWIRSYPCKTLTSQETQGSLQKFLEPDWKPKVIYTDNSLEFGKACEDLSWNHCTSTPHRSETNGIAERAVRRVKEGTSATLLQSGLDKWWAHSMKCHCYQRNIQDLLSDGKKPCERLFGMPFNGPVILFAAMVEYHPISAKYIGPKSCQVCSWLKYCSGEHGKETSWPQTLMNWRSWDSSMHRKC